MRLKNTDHYKEISDCGHLKSLWQTNRTVFKVPEMTMSWHGFIFCVTV